MTRFLLFEDKREVERVWNGKTGGVCNIVLPFQVYLLDQALSQGYSGAPVFYVEDIMSGVMIGNQPMKGGEILHLLGVQSGVLSDQTGGKISIVVPILYIWDIFELSDFQAYIKGLASKK
jgi:hypothetical protein